MNISLPWRFLWHKLHELRKSGAGVPPASACPTGDIWKTPPRLLLCILKGALSSPFLPPSAAPEYTLVVQLLFGPWHVTIVYSSRLSSISISSKLLLLFILHEFFTGIGLDRAKFRPNNAGASPRSAPDFSRAATIPNPTPPKSKFFNPLGDCMLALGLVPETSEPVRISITGFDVFPNMILSLKEDVKIVKRENLEASSYIKRGPLNSTFDWGC